MKSIAIGLHLGSDDITGIADATPAAGLAISSIAVEDDQPLGDRDLLLRVAEVRARLLDRATFIAIRYGFTFRSATEADEKISAKAAAWRDILEKNRSRVELTLKVPVAVRQPKPDRHAFKTGAAYVRALQVAKNAAAVSEEFKRAAEEHVGALCVARRWITRDAATIELAGLIERDRLPELERAGRALKAACPDVPFLLSAPWPLEEFANADHE